MIRLISGLAMLVVGIVVLFFAIANRAPVLLDFWPLPYTFPAPVNAVVVIAGLIGFVSGGVVMWISAGRVRRRARFQSRRASGLEKDLDALKRKIEALEDQRKP